MYLSHSCAESSVPGNPKDLSMTQAADLTPTSLVTQDLPAAALQVKLSRSQSLENPYWYFRCLEAIGWNTEKVSLGGSGKWPKCSCFAELFYLFSKKLEMSLFLRLRSEGISFAVEEGETSVTCKRRNRLDYSDAQWFIEVTEHTGVKREFSEGQLCWGSAILPH